MDLIAADGMWDGGEVREGGVGVEEVVGGRGGGVREEVRDGREDLGRDGWGGVGEEVCGEGRGGVELELEGEFGALPDVYSLELEGIEGALCRGLVGPGEAHK